MQLPGKKAAISVPVDLQSLVDTHERPFVVIDSNYRVMAINSAYERAFGVSREQAIGQPCYKVSHNNDAPCHESGEDCPHVNLFEIGKPESCLHIHYDANHRMCQVRVTAYPLYGSNGELYMGEMVQQISGPEDRRVNGRRMVGKTEPFMACVEQLKMMAAAEAPVLLQGESGTGKELAASFIHDHSPRSEQPFLTVDCTVLTETLFESELFGHARGAFTGSVGERVGLFEQANGGTLLLDEVGELPLSQQAKLLRVLESGQYRRVGSRSGQRKADVRIVCATNRHLWDLVKVGRFREDLYYRIACLAVRLPPLRERLDDIPMLATSLLEPISESMQQSFKLMPEAIERLKMYDYPGNVRELRNILFIAATHCKQGEIDAATMDALLQQHQKSMARNGRAAQEEKQPAIENNASAKDESSLHAAEVQYITDLLRQYSNNRREVAAAMNVSERTLYRKLKRYHLN